MVRQKAVFLKIGAALVALTLVVAACAGDDDDDPTPTPEPTATEEPADEPEPAAAPDPTPTEAPAPTPTEAPVEEDDDAVAEDDEDADDAADDAGELVARGLEVYETSCEICHGEDAEGGLAPNIQGQDGAAIRSALRAVPDMSGINLTPPEIEALEEYLQSLD